MSPVVQQVFDRLFDSLTALDASEVDIKSASESIGKIASAYPSKWCKTTRHRLESLRPASEQTQWIAVLSHMSLCTPFPEVDEKQMEPVVEYAVTSIHSVEERMRLAGFSSLTAIASVHPRLVLSKVAFSLKIYAPNQQILALLDSLITKSDENEKKIHQLLLMLVSEEGALKPELIGAVASCVAAAALKSTATEDRQVLAELLEALLPLCWRQDLLNTSSLFGVFKAVAALLTVLPDRTALHSVQTGVMRLLVHTTTVEDLVSILETVKILVEKNLLCESLETVSVCVPILIDIGIAIGPLAVQAGAGPIAPRLTAVFQAMTALGRSFLINRLLRAGELSVLDKLVSMTYLRSALAGGQGQEAGPELTNCITQLCGNIRPTTAEPYLVKAVLDLIATSGQVSDSTVTFALAVATMETSDDTPSSIRQYWFSPTAIGGDSGPSKVATRDLACAVLSVLAQAADRAAVLQAHVAAALQRLPLAGLDCLARILSTVAQPLGPTLLVWALLCSGDNEALLSLTRLSHPLLARYPQNEPVTIEAILLKAARDEKFCDQVCEILLSKSVLERLGGDGVMKAIGLAEAAVAAAPEGAVRRATIGCMQRCDQELVAAGDVVVTKMGSLIGRIAQRRFSDFTTILAEMTAHLTKTKHRLIVIIGLKKNSTELLGCIVRAGLGFAAPYCPPAELTDRLIKPCLETLKEIISVKAVIAPTSLLVATTLETVARIFPPPSGAALDNALLNELLAAALPLVVFNGESETSGPPRVALLAVRAITAISQTKTFTPTTSNFDHAMQFSVSLLVHRVAVFSTIATSEYDERIAVVSDLLEAVLRHSFNPWLGVSRLAQLLLHAGANSPLPILRIITTRVYARVVKQILATAAKPVDITEFLESLMILIPRLSDPVTRVIAIEPFSVMVAAAGLDGADLAAVLLNPSVVPSGALVGLCQLMLHASADGDHSAATATLELLNTVLFTRGEEISASESQAVVSQMLACADRQPAVQPRILDCLFSLSLAHLSTSLEAIVAEAVLNDTALSDSQIGAIKSLAREKKLLVGFLNFMSDLMNNSAPKQLEGVAAEAVVAAKAVYIALSVNDSLVPAVVERIAAPVFGTCLLFQQQLAVQEDLVGLVLRLLNVPTVASDTQSVEGAVLRFVDRVDESQVVSLVEFLTPFLLRDARGMPALAQQKRAAETALCTVIVRSDKVSNATAVKEAFAKAHSVKGLKQVLLERRTDFMTTDLKLVVQLLGTDALMSEALGVLCIAAELSGKISGNNDWRIELLRVAGLVNEIVSTRINCENVGDNIALFNQCLTLIGLLCDVAAFCTDALAVEAFRQMLVSDLLLELEIRSEVLSDLHDNDPQFFSRIIEKLRNFANVYEFSFADFKRVLTKYLDPKSDQLLYSRSSPSRSPLVVHGAAKLTVQIINKTKSPQERSVMMRALVRVIKARRKNFLLDSAKEHVIDVLGELVFSF